MGDRIDSAVVWKVVWNTRKHRIEIGQWDRTEAIPLPVIFIIPKSPQVSSSAVAIGSMSKVLTRLSRTFGVKKPVSEDKGYAVEAINGRTSVILNLSAAIRKRRHSHRFFVGRRQGANPCGPVEHFHDLFSIHFCILSCKVPMTAVGK